MNPFNRPSGLAAVQATDRGLQRLQFELALDMSAMDGRPPAETLSHAANTAGAELVFMLPKPSGDGLMAVVRLPDEERDLYLQVETADPGFDVADEAAMDQTLLALARASIEVMTRVSEDTDVAGTLAA